MSKTNENSFGKLGTYYCIKKYVWKNIYCKEYTITHKKSILFYINVTIYIFHYDYKNNYNTDYKNVNHLDVQAVYPNDQKKKDNRCSYYTYV